MTNKADLDVAKPTWNAELEAKLDNIFGGVATPTLTAIATLTG